MKTLLIYLFILCCDMICKAESGCNCKYGCNNPERACDDCNKGWYGRFCKKKNVALNGSAEQQSDYKLPDFSFSAGLAVDGIISTNASSRTCTHTAAGRRDPWWRVTLEKNGVNQIRYITIYNRNDSDISRNRRKGMEILVSGERCYKWDDDFIAPAISNVTCEKTMPGGVVTIKTPAPSLALCEVLVFVCSDYWFGEDCDKQCRCQDSSEVCDKVTGVCRSGCPDGRIGSDCQQECDNGRYGLNCTSTCGRCRYGDICNKANGTCPRGCVAGLTTHTCNTGCANGTYGFGCLSTCGQCLNSDPCNKTTGQCELGCADGWTTDRCNTGSSAVIVVVVVIIILLVVAGILVILWIWRRRKNDAGRDINKIGLSGADNPIFEEDIGEDVEEEVEDETAFSVEIYVDTTYENAPTYLNRSAIIRVEKLQEYIQEKRKNKAFKTEYKLHPYGINGLVDTGKLPENKKRNRFAALYPYDHSRVILNDGGDSDYINASYIQGPTDSEHYIATQGPNAATINDFWRLIWQEKVSRIVMLTNLIEMNKRKCEQYWPEEKERKDCGDVKIENKSVVSRANYTIRTFVISHTKSEGKRTVIHFHFTAWPDHDVPSPPALITFWKKVRQMDSSGPMVVHCSAGVGRTGTFIALDYLMDQAQTDHEISVYQCVAKQREARMNMIQTVNQYEFVHVALLEALKSKRTLNTLKEFEKKFGTNPGYTKHQDALIEEEFKSIQSLKPHLSSKTVSDALLPDNIGKNKNKTILPGNKTRPVLSTPVTGTNNYINAVVLPFFQKNSMLVATQSPLQHTIVDFWRLVYDHDCFTIVCLDNVADPVYPSNESPLQTGPFIIDQSESNNFGCYTERKLLLRHTKQNNQPRTLTVYSFQSQTISASRDPASLLELVSVVYRTVSGLEHKVLFQCPDGAKLCGLVSCVLNVVSRLRVDSEVDIYLAIRELQLFRPQFMLTIAQYKLCYDVVKEYIRSNDVYANM